MMGGVVSTDIRGAQIFLAGGNCQTSLIIYLCICLECLKPYIGKTINELRVRINGHRAHMKEILAAESCKDDLTIDDTNCLAAHAHFCHGVKDNNAFNLLYSFSIIQKLFDPNLLLYEENNFI